MNVRVEEVLFGPEEVRPPAEGQNMLTHLALLNWVSLEAVG